MKATRIAPFLRSTVLRNVHLGLEKKSVHCID